ncbi:prevent-host-death family protein [Prauserella shujinwangii]|uniref:Antitoxin n=1 Tax=Prauserella shujinwangii TaxID=1453103 RepID=A0A2T0LMC9_9PSEU|nr:type II toxin-antitoxin system Phd/YefM family antitoxin [Prauserella shujinwangii]PRX44236.1 prevent-host-death family protein [Prauserella shujinwangii]
MKFNTDDIVSVTDAAKTFSSLVRDVTETGRNFVVVKNNKPAAVLADIGTFNRLERIEEAEENLRLLSIALARTITDSGRRHDLTDVAAEFGVDLDEVDAEDEDDRT